MSKRILIVEDERNLARFVSLELQHEGYDVVTADNGREGLELALEKDFDLILLDLMLPEMDGFDTLSQIRGFSDVKAAFITATRDYDTIEKAREMGVEDYITKPFLPAVFLETIHGIIE